MLIDIDGNTDADTDVDFDDVDFDDVDVDADVHQYNLQLSQTIMLRVVYILYHRYLQPCAIPPSITPIIFHRALSETENRERYIDTIHHCADPPY